MAAKYVTLTQDLAIIVLSNYPGLRLAVLEHLRFDKLLHPCIDEFFLRGKASASASCADFLNHHLQPLYNLFDLSY